MGQVNKKSENIRDSIISVIFLISNSEEHCTHYILVIRHIKDMFYLYYLLASTTVIIGPSVTKKVHDALDQKVHYPSSINQFYDGPSTIDIGVLKQ